MPQPIEYKTFMVFFTLPNNPKKLLYQPFFVDDIKQALHYFSKTNYDRPGTVILGIEWLKKMELTTNKEEDDKIIDLHKAKYLADHDLI